MNQQELALVLVLGTWFNFILSKDVKVESGTQVAKVVKLSLTRVNMDASTALRRVMESKKIVGRSNV